MRKLSLIIIAFTLVLFTQCKKEKITENTNPVGLDGEMVPITLELPVDNGAKTDFTNFLTSDNHQATIEWGPGQETVYLAVPNVETTNPISGEITTYQCAQMIRLTSTSLTQGEDGQWYIKFEGNVNSAVLSGSNSYYTLYYFGNTGGKPTKVTNEYLGQEVITSVSMSLRDQDGSRDNLGKYHFATLGNVHVNVTTQTVGGVTKPILYSIYADEPFFTTHVAIAYLDFRDLQETTQIVTTETNLYGEQSKGFYLYGNNEQMADSVRVVFTNDASNKYNIEYFSAPVSPQYVKLSNNVKTKEVNGVQDPKSFIVLPPHVSSISAYGIEGTNAYINTYTFEGGTKSNYVYYRTNPAGDILPLQWNN